MSGADMSFWDDGRIARYRARLAVRRAAGVAESTVADSATAAKLGAKLDVLTGLIERVASTYMPPPVRESAPAPEPVPVEVPEVTAADLAKLSQSDFRALEALRWSGIFGHFDKGRGSSPFWSGQR